MFLKLFLLFTITPMVELYILIKLGQFIGAWETILMVIVMGFAGAALARSQGLAVISQFQAAVRQGQLPADQILDGLLVVAGGALLVTPGALTDFLGIALVVPYTRIIFREYIKRRITWEMKTGGGAVFTFGAMGARPTDRSAPPRRDDDVIDV